MSSNGAGAGDSGLGSVSGGGGGGKPRAAFNRDLHYSNKPPRHQKSSTNSNNTNSSNANIKPPSSGPGPVKLSSNQHQMHSSRTRLPPSLSEEYNGPNDKTCVVCYKEVKYYSVGSCDHSVCFECSSRMRVLMEQNECPICRQTLEDVIFTRVCKKPYKDFREKLRMFVFLPKWGLYLEDREIKHDFECLLEHRCPFCSKQQNEHSEQQECYRTFRDLKTHVQRAHELFTCDLCSDNIKLFSKERRFYSRSDLAHHKRKGDKNDTSHKGHPKCEFCDKRYFDSDDLYKHLRKDHYFCHFCDADGFNHYYNTYDDLRIHFRKEHYLCEEENCKDEKFTSVFRSEIDMKAHLTAVHSRLLGRHGTKQARVIDVEFNIKPDEDRRRRFAPRGGDREGFDRDRDRGGDRNDRGRYGRERGGRDQIEEEFDIHFEPTISPPKPKVDSVADFPMLEGSVGGPPLGLGGGGTASSIAQKVALNSGKNVSSKGKPSSGGGQTKWNAKVTGSSRHDEEFPALGGGGNLENFETLAASGTRPFISSAAMASSVNNSNPFLKPQVIKPAPIKKGTLSNGILKSNEDFPSLGKSSNDSSANGSAWKGSGVKMKGQTPRSLKINPAPKLERKIEVDPNDDFHFVPLSLSRARKDSITKKYDVAEAETYEEDYAAEIELCKKKQKVKEKVINPQAKAADALFNGGKSSKNSSSKFNSNSNSGPSTTLDDFPTLAPPTNSKNGKPSQVQLRGAQSKPVKKTLPAASSNSNPNIAGISVSGPPPGFSTRPSPAALDEFDMSFMMNAAADAELSAARIGSSGKLYIQPPEFTKRSARLIEGVKSSLSSDESSFEMFRSVSNQYKKGEIESKEYYELCQDMFGMTDFKVIFPELIALMPDIQKQQELLAAHKKSGGGTMGGLTTCQTCYQVIKNGDMSAHVKSHSAPDLFPALGKS